VGGTCRGKLGKFIGELLPVTMPGHVGFHANGGRIPARRDRRAHDDLTCFVEIGRVLKPV
jgi:hypothetical protein